MDALVLDGTYENGKIELETLPVGVKRARVRVSFLPAADAPTESGVETARQRAFARMRDGINFGGERFDRDELYEERLRELEARQDSNR